jgi:hypothetical protein
MVSGSFDGVWYACSHFFFLNMALLFDINLKKECDRWIVETLTAAIPESGVRSHIMSG